MAHSNVAVSVPPAEAAQPGFFGLASRHRLLRALPSAKLDQLMSGARTRDLATRESLFREGDAGHSFFFIDRGWIKLSRNIVTGRELVVEVAGPGTMFGELAVITGQPRSADATALLPSRLLSIDGRALVEALRASPDARLELPRTLAERLARANALLEDTLYLPAEARLARALIRLAALGVKPGSEQFEIDLGLSQKDLGDMTGLTRERINKQLATWRETGIVRPVGSKLVLLNMSALQVIADTAN